MVYLNFPYSCVGFHPRYTPRQLVFFSLIHLDLRLAVMRMEKVNQQYSPKMVVQGW